MKQPYIYMSVCVKEDAPEYGSYYYGKHNGELNDNYLGSGKNIKELISLYGPNAFKKTVLEVFGSYDEAERAEK